MTVRFGIFAPQGWRLDLTGFASPVDAYEAMTDVAVAADRGPWDSVWLFDHLHTVPDVEPEITFEAWVATAALLRDTRRVHLGQMVGCAGYRNPALLAKMASTAHVAGHGRLYAGLGAGWFEDEWTAYGYRWTSTAERMAAFGEAVEIVHRMWTQEHPFVDGRHHRIDRPVNEPRGAAGRGPALWIGGGGEKVTLRLVARYGDACNVGSGNTQVIRHKLAVLREHCEREGRDYDAIVKSTSINVFPTASGTSAQAATRAARNGIDLATLAARAIGGSAPDTRFSIDTSARIVDCVGELVDAGVQYVLVYIPGVAHDHEPLHRFASEVIPQFR